MEKGKVTCEVDIHNSGKYMDTSELKYSIIKTINQILTPEDETSLTSIEDVDELEIDDIYCRLSQTVMILISKRGNNDKKPRHYDEQSLLQAYNANLYMLTTFGPDAFEGFAKMLPALDKLLQQDSLNDIRLGLKMYADFIKKSASLNQNAKACYSYRCKDNIVSAITTFLSDDRIEITVAACQLTLTVANYEGTIFKKELSTLLPSLLNILSRFNNSQLNIWRNAHTIPAYTDEEWQQYAKTLASVASSSVKRIFSISQEKVNSPKASEFIICKILLCKEETKWNEFFTSNVNIFKIIETDTPKIVILWKIVYAYLLDRLALEESNINALKIYSDVLKVTSTMIYCSSDTALCYQKPTIKEFYKILCCIVVLYQQYHEAGVNNTDKIAFRNILRNLYATHKNVYTSDRANLVCPYLEDMLLPICDFMLNTNRGCHELKFVLSLYTSIIQHASHGDTTLIIKHKDKFMPIIMEALAKKQFAQSLTAIDVLGTIATYGGTYYISDCKVGLQLIMAILKEKDVCSLEGKLKSNPTRIRETAAATMAIILNINNFRAVQDKKKALSQWLDCFPVVINYSETIVANSFLIKLINEKNADILGEKCENLGQIVTAFTQVMTKFKASGNAKFLQSVEKSLTKIVSGCNRSLIHSLMTQQHSDARRLLESYATTKKKKRGKKER